MWGAGESREREARRFRPRRARERERERPKTRRAAAREKKTKGAPGSDRTRERKTPPAGGVAGGAVRRERARETAAGHLAIAAPTPTHQRKLAALDLLLKVLLGHDDDVLVVVRAARGRVALVVALVILLL